MNFKFNIVFSLVIVITFSAVSSTKYLPASTMFASKKFCGMQRFDEFHHNQTDTIDQFPWVAALIYKYKNKNAKAVFCSGSLINTRFVITAAQCLTQTRRTTLVAVRLGEHNVKTVKDCVDIDINVANNEDTQECNSPVDYGIKRKMPHPKFNRRTGANDIALLKLDKDVEYTDFIRPICVPKRTYPNPGELLHISGWGRKTYMGPAAETKKNVLAALITNGQCAQEFAGRIISNSHMCTRDLANNTEFTCQGDAGAPVMFKYRYQWILVGVSSWGGRCGTGEAYVHTKILKYTIWIQDALHQWR